MRVYTIGFTRSSAAHFFGRLRAAGVRRVLDVRLNATSQLSGFAKGTDLPFFLDAIAGIDYLHLPALAPTPDLLKRHRARELDWDAYAAAYLALIAGRRVEATVDRALFVGGCLLCSEATPEHCHRRLAVDHLAAHWGDVEVVHL